MASIKFVSRDETIQNLLDEMQEGKRREESINNYKTQPDATRKPDENKTQQPFEAEPVLSSIDTKDGRKRAALREMLNGMTGRGW